MKRSQVFPSNYFGKADVEEGPVTGIIASVIVDTIKSDHGEESKPILHFTARLRPMILNLVNWNTLEAAYGEDSDDWGGKQVEMYFDPTVMFGKERVGGVRVRIPKVESKFAAPGLNGAVADLMTFEQAKQESAAAGISYESLVIALKHHGMSAWNSARCTPIVRQLIDAATEKVPFGATQGELADVPF
jgi:hypothetical protein